MQIKNKPLSLNFLKAFCHLINGSRFRVKLISCETLQLLSVVIRCLATGYGIRGMLSYQPLNRVKI